LENPDDWLLNASESGEMNGDFPIESALIFRLASLAKHLTLLDINIRLLFRSSSVYQAERVMCSIAAENESPLPFLIAPNEV